MQFIQFNFAKFMTNDYNKLYYSDNYCDVFIDLSFLYFNNFSIRLITHESKTINIFNKKIETKINDNPEEDQFSLWRKKGT